MRLIRTDDIELKANNKIKSGFKGKALVAFVDLLGFSSEITSQWKSNTNDPLQRIMEIKTFVELARTGNQHIFYDYDETTVIGKANYPDLITFSDSFIFIQPITKQSEESLVLNLLAITGSIMELCYSLWIYNTRWN